MPSNPDTDTTYTLSGQFNDDGTEYITTLTPDDGAATTAVIPLMTAASSTADGGPGLVPKASAGDQAKFLKADGTWATPSNTDKYQRLYPSTDDVEYPITSRYNTTTGKSYYAEYGRYNVGVTLNPSKQTITAPGGFIGTADAAKSVPWSGITGKLNATASEAGLIKVSSVNTSAVTVNAESTNAGRYYSVELNSDGKAIVNVPWSDTNTDTGATSVEVTGTGNAITTASYDSASRKLTLTKGATYNNYSLPKATSAVLGGVKVGDNITVSDGTISLTKSDVTTALGYTPPSTDTDTGATSITVSGSGNAVTSATYDASTRKITLTKGATYNNYSHPAGSGASKKSGFYKFSTDGASHISGVTAVTKADITGLGIPGTDTNTAHAHTAGAGLTVEGSGDISGTTTYSLAASGVTAGTYGPTANVSGTNNTTINVPQITVDEYGRVTSITNRVYTSKNTDVNTTYSAGTGLTLDGTKFNHTNAVTAKTTNNQTDAAPGYGGTFKVTEPLYDAQGHITGVNVATVTMPSAQKIPTSFTITATATDDDVVILTGTNGSNKVTFNAKHAKKGPSSGYTSANSTTSISGYGASKTIKIPQITVDAYGHVTAAADESVTITMPSAQNIPTQLKNPYALTIGETVYDGSAAKTVTAKDLGLTGAMRYIGTSSSAITDGGTEAPTISSSTVEITNLQSGNVVLYGNKEFVWNGSKWELLGDEGSYKVKQSAVADPSASGTSKTFIATISQDANGKITATKKTVSTMSAATASAAGSTGLVPAPGAGKQNSFLRGDGTWQTPYTHPSHTAKTSGLYKITVDAQGHVSAATAVAKSDITALGIPGSDTNTHYTTGITAGATGTTSNSATTNGNTYIKIKDDSTHRGQIKITGSGATTVTSDANGVITISSTDNNTVYTHPSHTAKSSGLYKITVNSLGHVSAATAVTKADITGLGIPGSDTNYYHTRAYGTGLKISTGTGVSDMYVPAGTTSSLGVVKQHTSTDCTTYTSDDGATTPKAVKQAFSLFGARNGVYYVTGNTSGTAGTWTGSNTDIPELFTGLHIAYKIGIAGGSSSTTLNLTTAKGASGAKTVYLNASTAVKTQYPVGAILYLTYDGSAWKHSDYNTNTTYSSMSVNEGTTGTATSNRVLTAANLKSIINAHAAPVSHSHSGTYKKSATATGSTNASGTIANASITPAGTVSKPTFTGTAAGHSHTFKGDSHAHTVTPSTTDVYSITSVGKMFKAEVKGEVLVLTAGTAPTASSAIKAYTGLTVNGNTQTGTITETKITPAGTVSQPTFTGTAASHNHTFNGSGHTHTITLSDATVTVS